MKLSEDERVNTEGTLQHPTIAKDWKNFDRQYHVFQEKHETLS